MTERQGIEIDYCPKCRGVWLDRGELDKLIERATAVSYQPDRRDDDDDDEYRYREQYGKHQGHPRKRKGWLGEMFDFD